MTSSPSSQILNLYDVLKVAAAKHGDREFLIVGRRDEVVTFRELAEAADRFGHLLAKLGARPGDRVALWMTNHVNWAVAAYGVARCGCVLVAVNTRLSQREVAHMLELSRADFWIMEDNFLGKIQATDSIEPTIAGFHEKGLHAPKIIIHSSSGRRYPGTLDWHSCLADIGDTSSLPPAGDFVSRMKDGAFPELSGVAAILSTSGTTGAPKGVMLGHEGLIRLAAAVGQRQKLDETQKFYSIAPFFHCSGYMHGLLTNLIAGSTYYSTRKYDVGETWDVLTEEGVTAYHGFIGALQDIAKLPQFDAGRIARFDRAWYSAPAAEMARLEGILEARMCEVYGLTETGGNVAICRADDPLEMRHDSDGRPHDDLEVRIVDPAAGVDKPDCEPGEILIRGWNVMQGYFRDSEATARTIDGEGWLHTGDQGARLPGGYIKFLSRIKEIIRVGGENLAPAEVEEVLIGHPAISEAAVVAEPHDRLVEQPIAFLVLKPEAMVEADQLTRYCSERLANFKVPRRFIVVASFPKTGATNRVQKSELRKMLEEVAHA